MQPVEHGDPVTGTGHGLPFTGDWGITTLHPARAPSNAAWAGTGKVAGTTKRPLPPGWRQRALGCATKNAVDLGILAADYLVPGLVSPGLGLRRQGLISGGAGACHIDGEALFAAGLWLAVTGWILGG